MTEQARAEVCVGVAVVRDGSLLLIERGRGVGRGLWSIPGGRVEFGETLAQAAKRELYEETGLRADTLTPLGHVERIGPTWHYVIHDFLWEMPSRYSSDVIVGDDAAAASWVELDELHSWPNLAPGLLEFLVDHAVVPPHAQS